MAVGGDVEVARWAGGGWGDGSSGFDIPKEHSAATQL